MKKLFFLCLLALISFIAKAQDNAVKTAEKFLELYNSGHYDQAVPLEVPHFKEGMPLSDPARFEKLTTMYGAFDKIISADTASQNAWDEVKLKTEYANAFIVFRFMVGKADGLIYYFAMQKVTPK